MGRKKNDDSDGDDIKSSRGRGYGRGRTFAFRKGSARAQHLAKVSHTRKEKRKNERRQRKAKKHEFILVKVGVKSAPVHENPEKIRQRNKQRKKRQEKRNTAMANIKSKEVGTSESEKIEGPQFVPISAVSSAALQLKEEEAELAAEMKEVRKKRLLEENEEEDRYINMLSKRLKLNKKAKIPASFREDGLDYLLEICDTGASKKKATSKNDSKDESIKKQDFDEEYTDSDEELKSSENLEEEDNTGSSDSDTDEERGQTDSFSESDDEQELVEIENTDVSTKLAKKKKNKNEREGVWEDIYGRLRGPDGKILDNCEIPPVVEKVSSISQVEDSNPNKNKYIPPMRRGNQTNREKIQKSLKGLLNRLSESNMHSIVQQIEDMYMKNSRNEMNESILEFFSDALIKPVLMPERPILEHVMVIAILHANVGIEVGAFFIQSFIKKFHEIYNSTADAETDKRLENLALLSSFMFHFKVVDGCLIYDLLNFLAVKFTGKDIEIILTILKSVGFKLRKDNPVALKSLILILQQKANLTKNSDVSSRVKFMLEIILAIRNNNMNKIPNYDPSFGEHLLKMLKSHLHMGNYVSEMKITMQDLLNADTKGRWWIVGSAWTENIAGKATIPGDKSPTESKELVKFRESNEKLLDKARSLGMNTDTRRNIFCILMSADDYLDAFEKLMRLGLKNQVERDIIHVIIYCCLHEKKFNHFYAFLASKLCQTERRFILTTQFSLWDRLKDLKNNSSDFYLTNLSRFMVHLINEKSLPLAVLKILDFADLDKNKLNFLKKTLSGVLLQDSIETLEEIFAKIATSENLHLFRESLKLFMNHFLLKGKKDLVCLNGGTVDMSFEPEILEKLNDKVQIAERAMSLGQSRYPSMFKLEVAEYVKCIGQRNTSRLFDISQRRIFDWVSSQNNSSKQITTTTISNSITSDQPKETKSIANEFITSNLDSSDINKHITKVNSDVLVPLKDHQQLFKLSKRSTTQIRDIDIEKSVFEWVKCQLPIKLSSTEIRDKARELYSSNGFHNFKCSYGWYRRWSKRFQHISGHHKDNDSPLVTWLLQQFDNNQHVTHLKLQNFSKDYVKNKNIDFKGSGGWSSRFFKRHHIHLNWDGHYEYSLPYPLDNQVEQFLSQEIILKWRTDVEFEKGNIGCMDEIPLSFTSTSMGTTHDGDGVLESLSGFQEHTKYISNMRRTTFKNCEATVILSFLQTGLLLPPMIIVKSQKSTNLNLVYTKCNNPVIVFYAESCEPNIKSLEKWIDLIWMKNIKNINEISFLLCDGYEIHTKIKNKCQEQNISIQMFPLGTACKLQPLNVFAKQMFLKGVRDEWGKYMKTYNTTNIKINLPSNNDIVDWVYTSFLQLKQQEEELKKSFSVTGIFP